LGTAIDTLPMTHLAIWQAIDAARQRRPEAEGRALASFPKRP